MSALDVKWHVTRVLLHPGKWRAPEGSRMTFTEDGIARSLDAGEWIQHSGDGAIAEIVHECPTQELANERALRLAKDDPRHEYRICLSVPL